MAAVSSSALEAVREKIENAPREVHFAISQAIVDLWQKDSDFGQGKFIRHKNIENPFD